MSGYRYTPRYNVCHIARRTSRHYQLSHAEVVSRLGPALLDAPRDAAVFHSAMGNEMYLTRHPNLSDVREAVRLIQTTA